MLGGIEAGGTKFVCGVGTGPGDLVTESFPTTDPATTLENVINFFRQYRGLEAIGIGSFGPVDLNESSATYGYITATPKVGWRNFDLRGSVAAAFDVPVAFETDVNAAILGEARWGAARGLTDAVYVTVGTGIGGGAISGGNLVHGLIHSEMGHLRIPHDLARDPYTGHCPFHGDCLEGLACGPAMAARWGADARTLPASHPAWALEAHYLALGLVNVMVTLSPQRILIGGGVMQSGHLLPLIWREFDQLLNGYLAHEAILHGLDTLIQAPQLGNRAGVLGTIALAEQALRRTA